MNPERTITLTRTNEQGELEKIEVKALYCAASETGYQSLSSKKMDVFMPEYDFDDEGKVKGIKTPPKATDMDYLQLATACIVAAYERDEQEPPITSKDILYNSSREEIIALTTAVMEMYFEWLTVPKTFEKEIKEKGKAKSKNGGTPTKSTRQS